MKPKRRPRNYDADAMERMEMAHLKAKALTEGVRWLLGDACEYGDNAAFRVAYELLGEIRLLHAKADEERGKAKI